MKRIIEKETKLFIRDDFYFDEETEIGLDVKPAQGFYLPCWNGTEWVEGGQAPEPIEPEPQAPTMEQMAIALMQTQTQLQDAQDALDFLVMGGI
jgi:hypothetical protein